MNAASIYYQPPRPERKALLLVLHVDDIMPIGRKPDRLLCAVNGAVSV
jgi:hypothetical protein